MNAERRKRIGAVLALLEQCSTDLEALQEDEQEALDNLPDSLRDGDRGEKAQTAVDALEAAGQAVTEAIDRLQEAAE